MGGGGGTEAELSQGAWPSLATPYNRHWLAIEIIGAECNVLQIDV